MTPTEYLRKLEQANVVNSLDNLMTFPRLRKLIERGSVSIHGAYFGVATGSLLVCDREGSEFVPVAQAEHAKLLQAPRFLEARHCRALVKQAKPATTVTPPSSSR